MSQQDSKATLLPRKRQPSVAVREEDIPTSTARFIESFPPPPILLKPETQPKSAPSPPPIYRVLVGCDLSEFSEGVLREGIAITHGHIPAELHLAIVVEKSGDHYLLHCEGRRRHLSREVLESLMTNLLWRVGVPKGSPMEDALQHIALHVCVGEPVAEILRLSQELLADLIVVGSREHQGMQRRVWGSISKSIVSNAECSVVLVRPVDFVHGARIPSVDPPRAFKSGGHHLQLHHYHC